MKCQSTSIVAAQRRKLTVMVNKALVYNENKVFMNFLTNAARVLQKTVKWMF